MIWAIYLCACVKPDYHTWAIGASYLTLSFMESLIFFATLFHEFEQQRINSKVMKTLTGGVLHRLYIEGIQYYMVSIVSFSLAPEGKAPINLSLGFNSLFSFDSKQGSPIISLRSTYYSCPITLSIWRRVCEHHVSSFRSAANL
ncbi:hypothetical protein FRC15_002688 [Serendipita sp. 397]|nr:hypothetical protein FRC15_002688 [Serendipita sp. 397]